MNLKRKREPASYQRGRGCWHFAELDGGRRPSSLHWRGGKQALAEVKFTPLLCHAAFLSPSPICYRFFPHNLGIGLFIGYFLLLFKGWDCSTRLVKSRRRHRNWKQRHNNNWRQRAGESSGEAVVGSEVEGFYGLLRGVTSCSCLLLSQLPLPQPHLSPSSSISQQPPQESTGPEVSESCRPGHCVCFSSCHSSSRGWHTGPYATPQNSTGGHQAGTSARLNAAERAHQPQGLLFVPM